MCYTIPCLYEEPEFFNYSDRVEKFSESAYILKHLLEFSFMMNCIKYFFVC